MVKGMDSGSVFSFSTTRGHTTHISLLWVFVLFSFLCVAVVLLAGYQDGLKVREFGDVDVNGKLTVDGEQDLNGFRTKTYTETYSNIATNGGVGNSIGPIQAGFTTGHFVIYAQANVTTANTADIGAVTVACATPANAALGGTPANSATGLTAAATDAVGFGSSLLSGANTGFSATLTSLCAVGAAANASDGVMTVTAKVMAVPGAPDLP